MFDNRNYIEDENPFKLPPPPTWWLEKLHEFDPSLFVIPSRQQFCYRLAQKRPMTLPMHMVNHILFKESDTRMLARYGLIPVTTIRANPNWSNPLIWKDLHERAPWRNGGAERVAKIIESREQEQEAKRRAELDDRLQWYGKEAWEYYKMKTGRQSNAFSLSRETVPASRTPLIKLATEYTPVVSSMFGNPR